MIRPSRTIDEVQAPIIPMVAEWIRNTPGTLSLGQGMVSYPPPVEALRAIDNFGMRPDQHHYGPTAGLPQLLELIAEKLRHENAIDVTEGYRLMVTAGSNMAFLNVLMAITDPGDEIILPLPYYFNQEMAVRMQNCVPVPVACTLGYQLDVEAIRLAITEKTRAIVTVSPNNPSGAVYSRKALAAVNGLCEEFGLYHISDEAYEYFTYDDAEHFSPASIDGSHNHTISLYSLSKAYGFAGWRIGYMVFPEHLLSALLKVQDTNLICPPQITQQAAVAALEVGAGYCKNQLLALASVRLRVAHYVQSVGDVCQATITQGAFYWLLRLDTEKSDIDVVRALITDYKVAVIPGSAFGLDQACCLRLSYGMLAQSCFEETMERLVSGLVKVCEI